MFSRSNVAQTFPWVLAFAPIKYQGLGLVHPWLDQNIVQLKVLLTELMKKSLTGNLIKFAAKQLKLELGIPGPLSSIPWDDLKEMATPSWMVKIYEFAAKHNINIQNGVADIKLRRRHDVFIMNLFVGKGFEGRLLRRVNNVCQFLQVTTLSKICNKRGDRIRDWAWEGKPRRNGQCTNAWPRAATPLSLDISTWQKGLSLVLQSPNNRCLQQPLGMWTEPLPEKWHYAPSTSRLYKKRRVVWEELNRIQGKSILGERFSKTTAHGPFDFVTPPSGAQVADVVERRSYLQLQWSDNKVWLEEKMVTE